jgi:hypothetical protein
VGLGNNAIRTDNREITADNSDDKNGKSAIMADEMDIREDNRDR